ncbi:MAG: GGDEF domain-containing protein [Treponema sp.]|nr:GGDEF domain-containing protein [Treponema sp.]
MDRRNKLFLDTSLLVYVLAVFISALFPEISFLRSIFYNRKYSLDGVAYLYETDVPGKIIELNPNIDAKVFNVNNDALPLKFENNHYYNLYFSGHFDYVIPVNTNVLLRTDNLSLRILVNGKEIYRIDDNDRVVPYTRSPKFGYSNFISEGISPSDTVEIYLVNYYQHQSSRSFTDFFKNIYKSSPYFVSSHNSRVSLLETVFCFALVFVGIFVLLLYFVLRSEGQRTSYLFYLGFFICTTGLKLVAGHNIIMLLAPTPVTLEVTEICFKYIAAICFVHYLNSFPNINKVHALDFMAGFLNFLFIFAFLFIYMILGLENYSFLFHYLEDAVIFAFLLISFLVSLLNNLSNIKKSPVIILYVSSLIYILLNGFEISRTGSFFKINLPFEMTGFSLFIAGHIWLFKIYINSSVEARAKSRHMEDLAYRDALTHTGNRQGWLEKTKRMNEKFITGDIFGVAMFDLNNLKMVNDENGHGKGDEYIQTAADIICKNFKNSPVYRIGGDEFVAILNSADCEDTNSLREKLEMDCYVYYCSHPENKNFSIASGYAVVDYKTDSSFHDVFQRADENMYAHKKIMKERDQYERR